MKAMTTDVRRPWEVPDRCRSAVMCGSSGGTEPSAARRLRPISVTIATKTQAGRRARSAARVGLVGQGEGARVSGRPRR